MMTDGQGHFSFVCNICGSRNVAVYAMRHRELIPCDQCNSNARFRGIVKALQTFVLPNSSGAALVYQEPARHVSGIGMSDSDTYGQELARICDYKNTYYHTEPLLDITNENSSSNFRDLDFVISSDVLEHVEAPVSNSFCNIFAMLKPGGHLILSVPYLDGYETIEHFPHLHDFRIINLGTDYFLINRRKDGLIEFHENLSFHGGPGSVLEMRIFGEGDLLAMLRYAGFSQVHILEPNDESIGYLWDANLEGGLSHDRLNKSYVMVCVRP